MLAGDASCEKFVELAEELPAFMMAGGRLRYDKMIRLDGDGPVSCPSRMQRAVRGIGSETGVGIYWAEFRWSLPPEEATVVRFVEALGASLGYPCHVHALYVDATRVTGCFGYPKLWKNDSISLTHDTCEIEFALVPFFWAHAIACVQDLGGVFAKPAVANRTEWKRRKWAELKWTERARIRAGFGFTMSVI